MTPEDVAAIRAKYPDDDGEETYVLSEMIEHENELRRTIRELCDEIVKRDRDIETVKLSSLRALEATMTHGQAYGDAMRKIGQNEERFDKTP